MTRDNILTPNEQAIAQHIANRPGNARTSNTTETLEALIDQVGLFHVLTGLELVCLEKAEHILTNWQDKTTARAWSIMAKHFQALARKDTTA